MSSFKALRMAGILAGALVITACGFSYYSPTAPSATALVTFRVQGETLRVALTSAEQVAAARAAQGGGPARIPIGRIVAGAQVNMGWSWHLEDLTFAEVTIELCDGTAFRRRASRHSIRRGPLLSMDRFRHSYR